MPFGGLCPLPLRLGGTETEGWSAEQFARFSADLLALRRTNPIAVITFTMDSASPPVIHSYYGWNGAGVGEAPAVTGPLVGRADITFPASYTDSQGNERAISLFGARATAHGATAYVLECSLYKQRIRVACDTIGGTPTNIKVTVKIWATLSEAAKLEDYGGAPDKVDTDAETTPYAWSWYLELEDMLGSAFTKARTGYVHAQKLALARLFGAGLQRANERFVNNCVPASASDLLPTWAQCFNVQFAPSTPEWQVRRDCSVRMKLLTGCTVDNIDNAIEEQLDGNLVAVHRNTSDPLSSPPANTYWPGGLPGDPNYSLCGYQWSSGRAHVWAEVTWPPDLSQTEFLQLTDVRLFRLMDLALPAHATFAWDLDTNTGFILDVSLLGYETL